MLPFTKPNLLVYVHMGPGLNMFGVATGFVWLRSCDSTHPVHGPSTIKKYNLIMDEVVLVRNKVLKMSYVMNKSFRVQGNSWFVIK